MSTKLQLPAIGWIPVFAPCSECYSLVVRESREVYSGQQDNCYGCDNRLTVQRIAETGPSLTDMLSAFTQLDDLEKTHLWKAAVLAFDTRQFASNDLIERWMAHHELEGFIHKDDKMEWMIFEREDLNPQDATVLVMLDEGVVGRCLLTSENCGA